MLWGARIVLLVSVLLHTWAAIQLTAVKAAARPVAYVKPGNVQGSTGSRTMMLSGPVIALFVIGHLLHLTTGTIHPQFVELHAYENVVNGFSNPIASGLYIVAMILVGFHLSHGIWSMFQSMGFSHPRYTPMIKKFCGRLLLDSDCRIHIRADRGPGRYCEELVNGIEVEMPDRPDRNALGEVQV